MMFLTTLLALAAPACAAQQPVLERFRVDPTRSEVGTRNPAVAGAMTRLASSMIWDGMR